MLKTVILTIIMALLVATCAALLPRAIDIEFDCKPQQSERGW